MQHVACPPMTTEDADRLAEEFPRWLEKVSSRVSGGIVLIIDAVDCCQVSLLVSMLRYFLNFTRLFQMQFVSDISVI